MMARADRSILSEWSWTVDLYLLSAVIILILFGVVLSFAASPPVADRIGAGVSILAGRAHPDTFYFIKRHIAFFLLSLPILFGASFCSVRFVRRLMTFLFFVSVVLLIAVLYLGPEIKGSQRWIFVSGISIQPSEFIKPAFIVLSSWLFSEQARDRHIPGRSISFALLLIVMTLLLLEPDLGQAVLVAASWAIVFYVAGVPKVWGYCLGLTGICSAYGAYLKFPHFTDRIDKFIKGALMRIEKGVVTQSDSFQIDKARDSFLSGGWFGRGPGEGTVKWLLPDSHADFIFAVLGEEFGIVVCLLLVSVICFVGARSLYHALRSEDLFVTYAIIGLLSLFCLQSAVNIAVNLHLAPTTGVTLPLVSYGGSSLVTTSLSMGCLIALCRDTPRYSYVKSRQKR